MKKGPRSRHAHTICTTALYARGENPDQALWVWEGFCQRTDIPTFVYQFLLCVTLSILNFKVFQKKIANYIVCDGTVHVGYSRVTPITLTQVRRCTSKLNEEI